MRSHHGKQKRISVIDAETDPFEYGRLPQVFAWGFFDGEDYRQYWGDGATSRLVADLREHPEPLLIYAHNGGKFDFFYLLAELENPVKIINGRIVSVALGQHELRDSYAILPIPLSAWAKDTIDYRKFERAVRDKHKDEILAYLESDCRNLYSLVSKFVERFDRKLTIGTTAMQELRKLHPFNRTNTAHDKQFRPYYFGGRVEAFEKGAIPGNWKVYDVNSMYPHAMRNFRHPTGTAYNHIIKPRINADGTIGRFTAPFFLRAIVRNRGALPFRTKQGLDFNVEQGEFFICSHELQKGVEYGRIEIISTIEAFVSCHSITFDQYVDTFMAEKIAGKQNKDKAAEMFAKFILNSSYGKFGQNPDNYEDYLLIRDGEPWPSGDWELHELHPNGSIWSRPSPRNSYFDVAIAASITSAARSILLEAMEHSTRAIYCDTDSIICEDLQEDLSNTELGKWKVEIDKADMAFIGGKKLYALFNGPNCVKTASKGVRLSGTEIALICSDAVKSVKTFKTSPNFKLDGTAKFVDREVKRT